MSFSSEVKEELSRQISRSRHCQLAELAAILGFSGRVEGMGKECRLAVHTENITLARKYFTLMKNTFGINGAVSVRQNAYLHKGRTCIVTVWGKEAVDKVMLGMKWVDEQGEFLPRKDLADGRLVQNTCCRRAFVRGAFLSSGSMSDPEKSYHFEIVCPNETKARQMQEMINSFSLDAKIVQRKKCYVVYLKEGSQIVDILNVMEAHVALMNLENVRILKEMRNSVNRQVNCETANINKTVNAAVKQMEDINYIAQTAGLSTLSEGLQEMARLRLQFPEAPLKELGAMLSPPVGKSGVNHRLRKLSSIAEELKQCKEEQYGKEGQSKFQPQPGPQ